jgi:tryptophan-rich sensory protein
MTPTWTAVSICATSAVLEGVCAGGGLRRRWAELVQPRGAPPFPVWIAIGLYYYVMCFLLACEILAAGLDSPLSLAALVLLLTILVANATWNALFFRFRSYRASWLFFFPYSLLVAVLTGLAIGMDLPGCYALLGYEFYLPYALWWTYRIAQLNPRGRANGPS